MKAYLTTMRDYIVQYKLLSAEKISHSIFIFEKTACLSGNGSVVLSRGIITTVSRSQVPDTAVATYYIHVTNACRFVHNNDSIKTQTRN